MTFSVLLDSCSFGPFGYDEIAKMIDDYEPVISPSFCSFPYLFLIQYQYSDV